MTSKELKKKENPLQFKCGDIINITLNVYLYDEYNMKNYITKVLDSYHDDFGNPTIVVYHNKELVELYDDYFTNIKPATQKELDDYENKIREKVLD